MAWLDQTGNSDMAGTTDELFQRVAGARREWMACFDAITDYVLVKARDLRILKANRAVATLLGKQPQELIGHTCQELFGLSEPPPDEAVVLKTFETGVPQDVEMSNLPRPGEFHVATYPLCDGEGEVVAVVEFIRDVSEQKMMQRQLLQSARMAAVGELAAGVAHNFGNILMGVGGSLELMILGAQKEGIPDRVVSRMEMMHRELMRGDDIVKRLLSFARGSDPSIERVAPAEVMESVVGLCQAHPLSKGIAIRWEAQPGVPDVLADPAHLREVLMNLVLNALQATPRGGRVQLTARPGPPDAGARPAEGGPFDPRPQRLVVGASHVEEPTVLLAVADTGRGIPPDDMQRLFTPFFSRRADGSQGTGLGLCVSLGMVESMQGQIVVESAVGVGTTMTVVLPAAEPRRGGQGRWRHPGEGVSR